MFALGGGFFQFCEDWYDNGKNYKTVRGGSWFHSEPIFPRASYREPAGPKLRFNDFSFRAVLASEVKN
jgi:formylglycine-generating enzyme required for sulfatase activity